MKSLIVPYLLILVSVAIVFGLAPNVCEACVAFQEKSAEADELEKMILERIKQRKAEMAKERKEKGLPPVEEKKTSARPRVGTTPAKAAPQSANMNATTADKSVATPLKGRQTDPKVLKMAEPTTMTDSTKPIDPDVRIQFSFAQEEWADVIQFFADEVGYGLFMGSTGPPEGTYTCQEPEMGLLEALDYLNSRLGILDPPHVLIRNGTQLVLVNESDVYPQPLVPIVRPDQLFDYGKYEVVRCVFDLESLDGNVLATQIRELVTDVHQDGFSYIQAANRMEIRERVLVLREFNQLVQNALRKEVEITTMTYECQHIEPENLLLNIRQLMNIPEGQFQTQDGTLRFSVQPLGNKIFLTGSPKRLNEFEKMGSLIDVEFVGDGNLLDEKPYLMIHPAPGDLEVVFQVIQTLLDGEPNVKLDKDDVTGNLYVWASKRVQDIVSSSLIQMAGGDSFTIIPVSKVSPTEAVSTVEDLLGIDPFAETSTGPKLVADSDNDRVMVHGTPQEIALVTRMIEKIDDESTDISGPRRPSRFIEAPPRDIQKVIDRLQIPGIMETMGRSNRLRLILPQDRDAFRNRNRLKRNMDVGPAEEPDNQGSNFKDELRTRLNSRTWESTQYLVDSDSFYVMTTNSPFQDETQDETLDDESQIGQTTDRPSVNYQGVEEPSSVPGAPVEIRFTEQGILINSKDLDAADDLERLILNLIEDSSEAELPFFLLVRHRDVNEVKAIVEHICGLESSSGGGGGGGIGGLIGGAVQNAVGGAAGDALGGLLGGGGGGLGLGPDSAGSFELEGEDVRLGVDGRNNYLIVTGATTNDAEFIREIIEIVDVDSPPIAPMDIGMTYKIEIRHRDPMVIKEKVQEMLSQRFRNASGNATQQQPNAQQQIQQAVLSQLQGRNRGRRGGSAAAAGGNNAEQPKATLGVDEELGFLLVTGPEFIYLEVKALVAKLDIKTNSIIERETTTQDALFIARQLQALNPTKITIEMGDASDEEGGTGAPNSSSRTPGTRGGSSRSGASSRSSSSNPRAIQQGILDAIRQRGGGTRGNTPRGGNRR